MQKHPVSLRSHNSPGTPDNSSRRHISATAIIPFNSYRALPSKWDDAERWITSPLSGNNAAAAAAAFRTPSKSGPLGPRPRSTSFVAASPLTTGVLVPQGISLHYANIHHTSMSPSHSAAGWTDLLTHSSSPTSTDDEKLGDTEDPETEKSHVTSRRDMATQMSPEGSQSGQLSFVISPPMVPLPEDQHSNCSTNLEVRDVQVDKRVTVTSQSRKDGARMSKQRSPDVKDIISSWNTTEVLKKTSKLSKQEARIAAWENLQKAKAEASIKRLEMKLEKKRTASMDKILNKLRIAQTKAQDLRESVSDNHANNAPRSKPKAVPFKKLTKMGSLGSCFTGHL